MNFFNGVLLKLVPSLGYKGIVDTQIRIYKKLKQDNLKEENILNIILDTRRETSLNDIGADSYYQDLIAIPNKTLEKTIWAIIDWELFSSMEAYERRGRNKIPLDFVDRYKQEILAYIRKKVNSIP